MTLEICHLYGNLMNTYGDNGNLLMLHHIAESHGIKVNTTLVSLGDDFSAQDYDIVFFGGGQDYEQALVSKDIQTKKNELLKYIENDGVIVGICGGYQLLGHYYINASGQHLKGIGAIDFYSDSKSSSRLMGDIKTYNERFNITLYGYENHAGRTYLGESVFPLGIVKEGYGNNGEDKTEGCMYKNTFCSYFHGPMLVRNQALTKIIIDLGINNMNRREEYINA